MDQEMMVAAGGKKTPYRVTKTAKQLILAGLAVCLFAFGVGAVVIFATKTTLLGGVGVWASGLALGWFTAGLRIVMLDRVIFKSVDLPPNKARLRSIPQFLLRYAVAGCALAAAALLPEWFNIWGCVVGLLAVKPSAWIVRTRGNE